MTENFNPVELAQAAERYEDCISHVAELQGRYFASLLEHRVPENLAQHLVVQWSQLFWESVMFPTGRSDD